ncbi:MAG TPA: hypothetical protein V6C58_14205 [Allocoleopsis sp.]
MGNTASTLSAKKFSSIDLGISQDEFNDLSNTCIADMSAQNVIEIIGSRGIKLSANQQNEASNLCLLKNLIKSGRHSTSINKILDDLQSKAKTYGGFPSASSKVDQYVHNEILSRTSQDTYNNLRQQCISNMDTDNIIKIMSSEGVDAQISQVNKAYNECIQEAAVSQNILNQSEIDSQAKIVSDVETSGFDLFKSLGGLLGSPIILAVIAVVVVIIVLFS